MWQTQTRSRSVHVRGVTTEQKTLDIIIQDWVYAPHPLPFLFDAKSRTTRIMDCVENRSAVDMTKMGTYDWLSVNPRGNTGSRRKSKNNLRGITMGRGPIWGITSLTSSFILSWSSDDVATHLRSLLNICYYLRPGHRPRAQVIICVGFFFFFTCAQAIGRGRKS